MGLLFAYCVHKTDFEKNISQSHILGIFVFTDNSVGSKFLPNIGVLQ